MGYITVKITLTSFGDDIGPIDLYTDSDNFTLPIETGLNVGLFVDGYYCYVVPDNTTIIRVQSTTVCTNYIDLPIGSIPLPTPTPSATMAPTPTPSNTPPPTPTQTPSNSPPANAYTVYFDPILIFDDGLRKKYKTYVKVTPEIGEYDSFRLYFQLRAAIQALDPLIASMFARADRRAESGGTFESAYINMDGGEMGEESNIIDGNYLVNRTNMDNIYFYVEAMGHISNNEIRYYLSSMAKMTNVTMETGGGTYTISPIDYYMETYIDNLDPS